MSKKPPGMNPGFSRTHALLVLPHQIKHMKYKANKLVVIILSLSLLFVACNPVAVNKKAEQTANTFFNDLQKKNFDSAASLLSSRALKNDDKKAWLKVFHDNNIIMGDIRSFTKTSGFNIYTSTEFGTVVKVAYDVQWQYGKSVDS